MGYDFETVSLLGHTRSRKADNSGEFAIDSPEFRKPAWLLMPRLDERPPR
jgi:hypothetical protein